LGRKRKWEYFRLIYGRYGKADRKAKHEMLNEFCLTTGYQRKYAIRILNGPAPGKRRDRPVRKRGPSYGHELLSVLTSVWEAAGYPWSVRLIALLSAWMPWIRKRFKLSAAMEKQLLSISPRQMDRRLAAKKNQQRRRIYGRTKPGYLLKHHIPVKTDRWDVKSPGFTEVDLVSHSRNSGEGEFGYSLNQGPGDADCRWILFSMYCRPVGQVIFANWLATTSAMSGKSPIRSSRRLVPGSLQGCIGSAKGKAPARARCVPALRPHYSRSFFAFDQLPASYCHVSRSAAQPRRSPTLLLPTIESA
jgi:hypothetical protein